MVFRAERGDSGCLESWVWVPNALASGLEWGVGRGEPVTVNCVSLVAGRGACIGFRSHSLA